MFARRCCDSLKLVSVFSRGTVPYVLTLYDSKSCMFLMLLCFSLKINWDYFKEGCQCYLSCLYVRFLLVFGMVSADREGLRNKPLLVRLTTSNSRNRSVSVHEEEIHCCWTHHVITEPLKLFRCNRS